MRTIKERGDFDVAFVITSSSGGTGSSFSPPLIEELKNTYDFPVYGVVIFAIQGRRDYISPEHCFLSKGNA
ncbi:MAG: Tubulin/FtsZ family, GTPase domain [Candidatus Methanomarinus sp.]|nr:MAG: Tubulin/FtsZ family, GTPase domain [ANME-2 cluster archaeon]